MTPVARFDSVGKRAVRQDWNTPILRFLNREHGVRYRYVGLPGVDVVDVKLWRDMIDHVVAFEIPAHPTRDDPQGRRNIRGLRRNLRTLGIPGHAFFGPMEEVVVLRKDYDGTSYTQNGVVTLYNLDFCDEIASRISTRDRGQQMWRFEAIRQILRDQAEAFREQGRPRSFLILLTVRDQMDARKLRNFLAGRLYDDTRAYVESCGGAEALPDSGFVLGDHTWALKAFLYDTLRQYFANPNVSATFFPIVQYWGTRVRTGTGRRLDSPMLHCMIFCRFSEYDEATASSRPEDYLTSVSSVAVTGAGGLEWQPQAGEPAVPRGRPSPLEWLGEVGPGLS